MNTNIAHLCKRNDIYYFRMRVPDSAVPVINKREIKRSLKTSDLNTATSLCILIRKQINSLFEGCTRKTMSKYDIKKAVADYMDEKLQKIRHRRMATRYLSEEDKNAAIEEIDDSISELIEQREFNFLETQDAQEIIKRTAPEIEKGSKEYFEFCLETMDLLFRICEAEKDFIKGDYRITYLSDMLPLKQPEVINQSMRIVNTMTNTGNASSPSENGQHIKELMELYSKEKINSKDWEPKTQRVVKGAFDLFLEVYGDIPIKTLNRRILVAFRDDVLKHLPANRNKFPEFTGKNYKEVIKINTKPLMRGRTISEKMSILSAFFAWCVINEYIPNNPGKSLELKNTTRADEERDAYSREDVEKILTKISAYREDKPSRYWVPLIALFSGMRQNEICQLHCKDIIKDGDIYCFNVEANDNDKKLKTDSAKRLVPIHPMLIDIGFLDYVKERIDNKDPRLWMDLKFTRGSYAERFEKWYSVFNRREITGDRKKTFHSFRHLFMTVLKHAKEEELIIAELVGHANHSMTTGRYGKKFPSQIRFDAVCKFDLGIDVPGLLGLKE